MNQIGDIKYSILKPDDFRKLPDGENWLPMDGGDYAIAKGIDYLATTLGEKYNIDLPDARGMFIRVMNENRDDKYTDPDHPRIIGKPQENQTNNIEMIGFDWGRSTTSNKPVPEDGTWSKRIDTGKNAKDTNKDGITLKKRGVENRPNNLAFYLYIKVN